jgi:hypothetical protein
VALLAAVLAGDAARAQSLVGGLDGVVRDEQGGAMPGVLVTLTGKQGAKTATTENDGSYHFVALEPGDYVVSTSIAGFGPQRRDDIHVALGKTMTVDFTLRTGGVTETVDVIGETPVDVTSSSTETTLDQDFLFNLPISRTNAATNTLNYFPGVTDGAAYGGDSDSGNALMLDGVDTRDPEGGTAWTFFNYNLMEEVQVGGLGAPAEFGGFTGGFVNTITKSGGNQFAGLFDINYTNDSDIFSGDNADEQTIALNPSLSDPAVTTKLLDVTAQFGGPIIQDKLFFFGSAQRYERNSDPSGPVTRREEVSPRLNGKLTFQPSTSNTFTGTVQYDNYNIIGRVPSAYTYVATDAITNREDAPEWVWMANWRHLFGTKTFSEIKFAGYDGFYDLNPEVNAPGRFDEFGTPTVSQGWFYYADRARNQINASISTLADKWGKHDLKFGVEIERSKVRNRYGYVNDILYYDYEGSPYLAYSYGYDIGAKNQREAVFVQDSWHVSDRLTLNLGLRGERFGGVHDPQEGQPDVGKVWSTSGLAPRLGFAFDATGDHKTVVKGTYSQYYEGIFSGLYNSALPGISDYVTYDVAACPSISEPCPPALREEIDRAPNDLYRIDPDIKHPRRDEITLGIERALGRDFRLAVTGIWRDAKNFTGSVIPSARWTPTTVTSTAVSTFPSRQVPVYNWENPDESETDILITNPDGFQFLDPSGNVLGTAKATQEYRAIMAVLSRRFSNRWQGHVSYVYSRNEGTMDNDGTSTFGAGRVFQTPTLALVNNEGPLSWHRAHELKIYGTYQIPVIEVALNGMLRYYSGRPYAAYQRFGTGTINFGLSRIGREPFLEPRGSRTMPNQTIVDLRLDKYFKFGSRKEQISFYVDVQNLLDKGPATSTQTRVPSVTITGVEDPIEFGSPSAILPARQVTLGARYSF